MCKSLHALCCNFSYLYRHFLSSIACFQFFLMLYDILDKMCGVKYFRISSRELTYTVAIDFKLVSLLFKVCHPYHSYDFFGASFLILTSFFSLSIIPSFLFKNVYFHCIFFVFILGHFFLIGVLSSIILFKMSVLINDVFSHCSPFDNVLFPFSLSYFYIGFHFIFVFCLLNTKLA